MHLNNYAHVSSFVVFCWGFALAFLTHIFQGTLLALGKRPIAPAAAKHHWRM